MLPRSLPWLLFISIPISSDKPHFDFVFGWSTGHVGSTSLSSASTYSNPPHITFKFEKFPRSISSWRNHGKEKEYEFARKYLERLDKIRGNQTLIDLGHHNMYFINGLLQFIQESPEAYRILFIRIRRHRYFHILLHLYEYCIIENDLKV